MTIPTSTRDEPLSGAAGDPQGPQDQLAPVQTRSAPLIARWRRAALVLLMCAIAAAFILVAYFYYVGGVAGLGNESTQRYAQHQWEGVHLPRGNTRAQLVAPVVRLPATVTAANAEISDDEQVIGVCVGNRCRAYRVAAMGDRGKPSVINDLVDGRAVTVTYWLPTDCSRVFADPDAEVGTPLELGMGGWDNQSRLVLFIGDTDYLQETGRNLTAPHEPPLPYQKLADVRTTWKAWRQAHPDTDLYIGEPAAPGAFGPMWPARKGN